MKKPKRKVMEQIEANALVTKTASRILKHIIRVTAQIDEKQQWLVAGRIVNFLVFKLYRPFFDGRDVGRQ